MQAIGFFVIVSIVVLHGACAEHSDGRAVPTLILPWISQVPASKSLLNKLVPELFELCADKWPDACKRLEQIIDCGMALEPAPCDEGLHALCPFKGWGDKTWGDAELKKSVTEFLNTNNDTPLRHKGDLINELLLQYRKLNTRPAWECDRPKLSSSSWFG
jgi:hypothetical protein